MSSPRPDGNIPCRQQAGLPVGIHLPGDQHQCLHPLDKTAYTQNIRRQCQCIRRQRTTVIKRGGMNIRTALTQDKAPVIQAGTLNGQRVSCEQFSAGPVIQVSGQAQIQSVSNQVSGVCEGVAIQCQLPTNLQQAMVFRPGKGKVRGHCRRKFARCDR